MNPTQRRPLTSLIIGCIAAAACFAAPRAADAGDIGPHLQRLADTGQGDFAGGRFAPTRARGNQTRVDVFIDADAFAVPDLLLLGANVRTVLPDGLMTADIPLSTLHAVAALPGVRRIDAARSIDLMMDQSVGPDGLNVPSNQPGITGEGVIVGVLDTGIDIEHPDFAGRILGVWDHTLDPEDVGDNASNPSGYNYGTHWTKTQIDGGYNSCDHRDYNGHGTHVAGTAAGAGAAPIDTANGDPVDGYTGVAPGADILVVKFDFDNDKGRNSDAAIVDGVAWMFAQANALGKPIVINMSLGSDYGPHDGTLPDERALNQLVTTGNLIVVAAGNAGRNNSSPNRNLWGPALHGSGIIDSGIDITIDVPAYSASSGANDDYIFFDGWYSGADSMRVQITTPNDVKYPSSFSGPNRRVWTTNGQQGGYSTPEGLIYVANRSASGNGWDTTNGDNNFYIEISDGNGNPPPSAGQWKIDLIPDKTPDGGVFHAWNGSSSELYFADFTYDDGPSNNVMTIGSPATARNAISVGAYQTKNCWPARDYADPTDPFGVFSLTTQCYGDAPIDYYDGFALGELAFFSSRGPDRLGEAQPFIAAPGVGIVASLSQTTLFDVTEGNYYRELQRVTPTGYYAALQGTSMATPNATGAIALLLQQALAQGAPTDPDAIKSYLAGGARIDSYTGSVPNDDYGYGKLDVSATLPLVQPPSCTVTETPEVSCSDGLDNDCNGDTDLDDANCQGGSGGSGGEGGSGSGAGGSGGGPSCELAQLGEPCTDDGDCCSNKCRGRSGSKTCK